MSVADDSVAKTEHSKTSRAVCYRGVWKASMYATVSEVERAVLVYDMKTCRGSRGIAPLILNLCTR